MSEMVERVARAICVEQSFIPDHEHDDPLDATAPKIKGWELFENAAKAAILAMREPTEDMPFPEAIKQYWRAMIDEALKG